MKQNSNKMQENIAESLKKIAKETVGENRGNMSDDIQKSQQAKEVKDII